MYHYKNCFLIVLLASVAFTACQDVIEIDLNESTPQYVIEGIVTNDTTAFQVRLTQTVGFDQPNDFPAVSNALVVIRDQTGVADTLQEQTPGVYTSSRMAPGIPGYTYTLDVLIGNQTFTAVSTMPEVVVFESLGLDKIQFGGADSWAAVPAFTDPVGLGQQYQFIQYINGVRLDNIFVADDRNSDGLSFSRPLIGVDEDVVSGDSIEVEMRTIDRATYKYFVALSASSGNGPNASVPANPDNVFMGSCLGYFSAHTIQRRGAKVP
jgi:hypothetical protein